MAACKRVVQRQVSLLLLKRTNPSPCQAQALCCKPAKSLGTTDLIDDVIEGNQCTFLQIARLTCTLHLQDDVTLPSLIPSSVIYECTRFLMW